MVVVEFARSAVGWCAGSWRTPANGSAPTPPIDDANGCRYHVPLEHPTHSDGPGRAGRRPRQHASAAPDVRDAVQRWTAGGAANLPCRETAGGSRCSGWVLNGTRRKAKSQRDPHRSQRTAGGAAMRVSLQPCLLEAKRSMMRGCRAGPPPVPAGSGVLFRGPAGRGHAGRADI